MEFPKRLYGEGLEPEVKKINNSCRLSLLTILEETMQEEYQAVMRDPLFKHIMAIQKNGLRFSGRLVHSFLCKELVTSKVHEKWFIFARRPLRFSLQEYHAVTGLEIGMEGDTQVVRWQDDKGFWSQILKTNGKINLKTLKDEHIEVAYKWDRADRIRLIYLCIIMGVIFGRDEKVHIPHLYIKLAMDLDKLRKYPWGLHSYDFLLSSIDKARKKLGQKDGFMMEGFLFALQIWIMEAIPDFGVMCGHKVKDNYVGPRCGNWTGCARVSYEDINGLEMVFSDKGQLFSYISRTGDGDVVCSVEYVRVDERKDERVDRMQQMINEKYDWSEFQWEPLEPESTEMEEGNEEEGEAQLDTENTEETDVTRDVNGSASESVRGKRKIPDKGAESRKMKLLCQRSAAMKGTLDAEAKLFLEGLVSTSFNSMAEKLITQVNERMDKLESEVTDLKLAVDLVGIRNTAEPQTCGPSKVNPPQSKKKVNYKRKCTY